MTPTDIILWLVVVWIVLMLALSLAGASAFVVLATLERLEPIIKVYTEIRQSKISIFDDDMI